MQPLKIFNLLIIIHPFINNSKKKHAIFSTNPQESY
jgi:hypothetical protein